MAIVKEFCSSLDKSEMYITNSCNTSRYLLGNGVVEYYTYPRPYPPPPSPFLRSSTCYVTRDGLLMKIFFPMKTVKRDKLSFCGCIDFTTFQLVKSMYIDSLQIQFSECAIETIFFTAVLIKKKNSLHNKHGTSWIFWIDSAKFLGGCDSSTLWE